MRSTLHDAIQHTTAAKPRLIPLTEWNDHHPWPPLGGLRHLVTNAKENGFDAVIRRVGGRILLDESAFFEWVNRQNKVSNGQDSSTGGREVSS